jgi:hypothetical protein
MVEASFVTGRRRVPADMLLLHERRRRLAGSTADRPSETEVASDEIFDPGEDQLIETESVDEAHASADRSGDVTLRRPIAHVSLTQVGWSGPIDHDALSAALRCYRQRALSLPGLGLDDAPFSMSDDGAALEVTLRRTDLDILSGIIANDTRAGVAPLVAAACLPDRLVGAQSSTRAVVSSVLAAYRRSSLSLAWHRYLRAAESAQSQRERDESAVAVLSTLRALLGER